MDLAVLGVICKLDGQVTARIWYRNSAYNNYLF